MTSVFSWPLRVYIEDTDAGGIVYYVNYLKFIERARTEFLRSLGFDKQCVFNNEQMFIVHSINCQYHRPAQLDDSLLATAELTQIGKTFLQMQQKVWRSCIDSNDVSNDLGSSSDDRELLFTADVKIACVDRQSMKPQRIPAQMLAAVMAAQSVDN
ncbi:MAG: tol-pal system-associated acyl-CoA thioesterase [Oceanicoccus sp.]